MKKSLRNTIKRIGALLLSLMIIISILGYSTIAEGLNISSKATSAALSQNQDEALNAYYSLCDYLGLDEHTDHFVWPDEYAGCYINSKNELVICLTTDDALLRDKYLKICGDKVTFEVCKYSLGEFQALCEMMDKYSHASNLYAGYKPDVNKLIVKILDNSTEQGLLEFLKNYPNKSEKLERMINDADNTIDISYDKRSYTAALKPGTAISNASGSFTACIWAYVTINGVQWPGIITCGHPFFTNGSFNSNYATVYASLNGVSSEFGTASSARSFITNDRDCAFIPQINMSFSPSYTAVSGGTITQWVSSAPVNTIVYFEGKASGNVHGTINCVGTLANVVYLNHGYGISMDTNNGHYIRNGDSGAPVYLKQNGINKLIGIQSSGGSPINNTTYAYAYASYIGTALTALNASIYTG